MEANMEDSVILDTGKGIVAGIAATIVLALLMFLKDAAGIAPGVNLVSAMMTLAGISTPLYGWIMFFVISALIVGATFAALDAHMMRPEGWEELARGGLFGVGIWLLVMIFLMPMTSAGAFAMKHGMMAPIVMFVAFVIYGVVLGGVYGALRPEPATT
jgi:hypothetical protein